MILPERVFGRSSPKRTAAGLAILLIFSATNSRSPRRLLGRSEAFLQQHEADDPLAPIRVVGAGGRGLRDRGMLHECRLDLGRGQAVAGDVDHVVDASHQPVVAVLVLLRAVARDVDPGPYFEKYVRT